MCPCPPAQLPTVAQRPCHPPHCPSPFPAAKRARPRLLPEPEDRLGLPRIFGDRDAEVMNDERVTVPVAGRRRVEPAQPLRVRAQVEQRREIILCVLRRDLQLQRVEQSRELEACERPQAVPRSTVCLARVFRAAVAVARRPSCSDPHQRHRQVVPLLSACLGVIVEDGGPEDGGGILTRACLTQCRLAECTVRLGGSQEHLQHFRSAARIVLRGGTKDKTV